MIKFTIWLFCKFKSIKHKCQIPENVYTTSSSLKPNKARYI